MKYINLLLLSVSFLVIALFASCGGGGGSTSPDPNPGPGTEPADLTQALDEVNVLSAPADVDAGLFNQLKGELSKQLSALAGTKFSSAANQPPPLLEANRVPVIAPVLSTREVIRIAWRDRNPGDYDNNGRVGAGDLLPLARRFGQALDDGEDDGFDLEIDGDGSGGIDLGDVKPIAQNYYNQVTGYNVYRRAEDQDGSAEKIGSVPAASAHLLPRGGRVFRFSDTTIQPGQAYFYFVRPVSGESEGVKSAMVHINPGSSCGMAHLTDNVIEIEEGDQVIEVQPGELLVLGPGDATEEQVFDFVYSTLGAQLMGRIARQDSWRIALPPRARDFRAVHDFHKSLSDPYFEIEYDHLIFFDHPVDSRDTSMTFTDPEYADQWGMAKVEAEDAWDHTRGSGITIGVVDTGIDRWHEDFDGSRISRARVSPTDNEYANGTVHDDLDGHGTLVSGVIHMQGGNSLGGVGLSYQSDLVVAKVGDWKTKDGRTYWSTTSSQGADGIAWVVSEGADVINMSWGSYDDTRAVSRAISDAREAGVILVAATGNDNTDEPLYPAAYYGVISVCATDSADNRWYTDATGASNYGSWTDIAAPGRWVHTAEVGDTYGDHTGTSLAAPFVTATVGLVLSLDDSIGWYSMEELLKDNAVPLSTSKDIGDLLNTKLAVESLYGEQEISTTADAFSDTLGPGETGEYEFTIANTGGYDLEWELNVSSPWIVASPDEGTLRGQDEITVILSYTAPTIVGTHDEKYMIWCNDSDENFQEWDIEITVVEPNIVVDPLSLTAELEPGETDTTTLTVENTGQADLTYSYTTDGSFISVTGPVLYPLSATLEPGEVDTFSVRLSAPAVVGGNVGGTYTGDLTFTSNDPDDPTVEIPVVMVVNDDSEWPEFEMGIAPIVAELDINESTTVTRTITNAGTGNLIWSVNPGTYTTFNSMGGTIAEGDDFDLEITVTAPSSEGTYGETLQFNTNDIDEMSPMFPVSLEVTDPREPDIDVDKSTITVTLDGGGQAEDSFTIANFGDRELNWTITAMDGWLSVDQTAGTTAALDTTTITVYCNCAPGGPYSGHLKIVSDDPDELNTWIQVDASY